MLIADRFLCWAERTPDKAAIVLGGQILSYGDLRERAEQVAMRVRAEWDDRIAPPRCGIMLPHGIDFISVFLGVTMAGAVAMVLDPKWTTSDVARVLSATPPALLFVDPARVDAVPSLAPGLRATVVGGEGIPLDRVGPPDPPDLGACSVSPDAPFYIGFTSGTTGEPKAFIRSHRSWLASVDAAAVEFPISADEHVLAPGRLLHSLFLYAVVETLSSGATVHLMHDFEADAGLGILRRHPVTRIHGVPTMYTALRTAAADTRFPMVRTLISGGAKLPPTLKSRIARMFPQATIVEYYGASELSFVTVSLAECPAESVGRPFHGVFISLRRDDGSEVAPGEIGRLHVRSDMVCSGYLRAEDNHQFYTDDGWATVGDLAWRDENGCIYLAGRKEGMMISGGLNVYPAEVEAVLQALPEVAEAAVFGLPDPHWGERVCAVIRWADRARLNRTELRERCSQRLDRRKCPQQFFATDQFAHTQSGKIAVAALRGNLIAGLATLPEIR